ncbi:YaaC-like protein [Laceyella sacchari]|uniref:YaaC family protein n=1 Tax=Laceyella sacchari TaxID=37482 RepID=UPI0010D31552|nr:YaaC family protein [Laceyella sacchari]TCW39368.1 YaaC-like protein [Laceyella sacchari]
MDIQSIKLIRTENPDRWLWSAFMPFQNEETARRYLMDVYSRAQAEHPDRLAYRNVPAFTSYMNQAVALIQDSGRSNQPWSRPILLYYGMMSMFKAWLLTRMPDYPQNATVLRHGLSTRKRKRSGFRFVEDDIRIQREGLFPLVAEALHLPIQTGESFTAKDLFGFIAELQPTYRFLFGQESLIPVIFSHSGDDILLHIPERVQDSFHCSAERLADKLNRVGSIPFSAVESGKTAGHLTLRVTIDPSSPTLCTAESVWLNIQHPWFYEDKKGDHYLWLGNGRPLAPIPELLAHLMLLFSLSMLCRYDPPLWGEIMLDNQHAEQILINELLDLVPRKFPQLMLAIFTGEKAVLRVE